LSKRDSVPPGFDSKHKHAEGKLTDEKFPDYEPIFSPVILTKKSKLVDLVQDGGTIGGRGFIVSPKLKGILEKCRLSPANFILFAYSLIRRA
jgi:hypothetical protein